MQTKQSIVLPLDENSEKHHHSLEKAARRSSTFELKMGGLLKVILTLQFAYLAIAAPDMMEVLRSLDLTAFIDGIKSCKIDKTINHEGHFTVFAPSNDAFENERWYPGENNFCSKMSFHIAKGYYKFEDIKDEQVVKALLGKRTIRFNIYPMNNNVTTANGRPIIDKNHLARNGVVHVLSDVMSAVYKREGSVISEIEECCPEHSDFLDIVKSSGLYSKLDQEGPVTLLAPNNGAFANLEPDFINNLKKNQTELVNFVNSHVIPLTYYSAGLPDSLNLKTWSGGDIQVTYQGGNVLFGNGKVTLSDVTAGNGVVHAIDHVLYPPPKEWSYPHRSLNFVTGSTVPDLVETAELMDFTSFAAALKLTGVDKIVKQEGPFTIFAPNNEAFNNPENYPKSFSLTERVKFHIAHGRINPSKVKDGDQVPTLLPGRTIKFNVYENSQDHNNKIITANGREISIYAKEASNGLICTMVSAGMDYINLSNGTLEAEIAQYQNFEIFSSLVHKHLGLVLGHKTGFEMTVFVPSNSVLEKALETASEQEVAHRLLLNHFVPKAWYTRGMEFSEVIRTLGGLDLVLKEDEQGYTINEVPLVKVDFTTSNGVFHHINGLL